MKLSNIFWATIKELRVALPHNEVVRQIYNMELSNKRIDYLDVKVEDTVQVSYRLTSQIKYADDNLFYGDGRQVSKIGSAINKVLRYPVEDAEMAEFVDRFIFEFKQFQYDIEIVSGKDITPLYLYNNCIQKEGSEFDKNCMRYSNCQEYFGIYEDNPNLRMLVAKKDGLVAARSLIWNDLTLGVRGDAGRQIKEILDKNKELIMLDRIYSINPQAKAKLRQWGMDNADLIHTTARNLNKFLVPKSNTEYEGVRLTQAFDKYKYEAYPWIDTMQYFSIDKKEFSNYPPTYKGHRANGFKFNSNTGGFNQLTYETPEYGTIVRELQPVIAETTTRRMYVELSDDWGRINI